MLHRFLVDYVDRGPRQLENQIYLLEHKCKRPDKFILLRGNHETNEINIIDSDYNADVRIQTDAVVERRYVIGVDKNIVDNNTFAITEYLYEYGSKEEAWDVLLSDPSLVISNAPTDQFESLVQIMKLVEIVTSIDRNYELQVKTVIGFMDQTVISGYFMSKQNIELEFNITSNSLFFFNVKEGIDADELTKDLNREFIGHGLQTIVLGTVIREAMSVTSMFFDLFSGYMGLGLVVGIAGPGMISLKAVHERRLVIGMMRAIGSNRKMIRYALLIENSFITLAEIILGSFLGIAIG